MGVLDTIAGVMPKLGPLKNPVMVSTTSFSAADMYFAQPLIQDVRMFQAIVGTSLMLLAVCIFLLGPAFWIFAFLRLPATTQEAVFLQEGKATVANHERITNKPARRKPSRDE